MRILSKISSPFTRRNLFKVFIFLCLVGAIGAACYFYIQNQRLTAASREVQTITQQVSKLIELPDEQPTLATVTEKEKLQAQTFFQKSENGDKVLIFPAAKKAILYRPSTNKLIEVAPFVTTDNSIPNQSDINLGTEKNESATVTLLNGSTKVGITNTLDDTLKKKFPTLQINAKTSAQKNDYTQTLVVDVSGKMPALAQQIASEIHGVVGSLPVEETKPNTDLLIIATN